MIIIFQNLIFWINYKLVLSLFIRHLNAPAPRTLLKGRNPFFPALSNSFFSTRRARNAINLRVNRISRNNTSIEAVQAIFANSICFEYWSITFRTRQPIQAFSYVFINAGFHNPFVNISFFLRSNYICFWAISFNLINFSVLIY